MSTQANAPTAMAPAQRPGPEAPAPGEPPGFLSDAQCRALLAHLAQYTAGGGYTAATIWSAWSGGVRWARNQITSVSDVRQTFIRVHRDLQGATAAGLLLNETTDGALVAAARRAERLSTLHKQVPQWELIREFPLEPMDTVPPEQLFSASTAALTAEQRTDAAVTLMQQAAAAGVLSAGYIAVGLHSLAMLDTTGNLSYVPYTTASYSVTVRDSKGRGSGWAGVDWPDWAKVDAAHLTQLALEKCLKSRNPVAVEPGRYTTILEPQAVGDFVGQLVYGLYTTALNKETETYVEPYVFTEKVRRADFPGAAKFGERVTDERLTLESDPRDPEASFPLFAPNAWPFVSNHPTSNWDWRGQDVFHPVTWIKDGVLTALEYGRSPFGGSAFGNDGAQTGRGLPNPGAFQMRVTGPTRSLEEMIGTTKRGLLVTRLANLQIIPSQRGTTLRGYTRDGLWLIEDGQVSKPVKNFLFEEDILAVLNRVEQVGVPQRVFHPQTAWLAQPQPVVVPALKIRDFRFIALADAV